MGPLEVLKAALEETVQHGVAQKRLAHPHRQRSTIILPPLCHHTARRDSREPAVRNALSLQPMDQVNELSHPLLTIDSDHQLVPSVVRRQRRDAHDLLRSFTLR